MAEQRIELANLIETVANQLRAARTDQPDAIIDLAECELEMAIQTSWEAGAGIRVWVLELGGRRNKSNTNTVRVKFTPHGTQPIAYLAQAPGPGPELGRGKAG